MSDAVAEIHAWFKANNKTLCCAESLTAGNIQAAISAQSGASRFFRGGVTAYDIAIKARLLNVDAAHAKEVNAVSVQVAQEMARGACALFEADVAVATTGYAEPYPDAGATSPYAFFAIVRRSDSSVIAEGRVDGEGLSRAEMQRHVTTVALQTLAEKLSAL